MGSAPMCVGIELGLWVSFEFDFMPRFSRIRLPALDRLARELRFAPRGAAARQIAAVLDLAREIDPARAYAEDRIIRRITGFAPDVSDPAQFVGEALLADLSAFAERVSAQSRVSATDLKVPLITLADLAARWHITPRTIERYRRRGLIGVRVTPPVQSSTLVFPETAVVRFESVFAALFDQGGIRARPPAARAPSTRRPRRRDRGRAFDEWRKGVGPTEIARRLNTTRATVHRLINSERADRLRALVIEPHPPPRDGGDDPLSPAVVRVGLGAPGDTDASDLARARDIHEAPDAAREHALARAYQCLLRRAKDGIGGLGVPPSAAVLDRVETDLRWAALLKVELLRPLRPLIVRTIEERAGVHLLDLAPSDIRRWTGEAFAAAAEALDLFDASKRGRLAAPVSISLARALAPLKRAAGATRARPTSLPLDDWTLRVAPWQGWLGSPVDVAWRDPSETTPDSSRTIRLRFGLGPGPPLTLAELWSVHGISPAHLWAALRH